MTISPVIDARSENLPWMVGVAQARHALLEHEAANARHRVFAHTTNTSAIGALVIHVLQPVQHIAAVTRSARAFMPPGSEP
jgi:hypothetical protein